MKHNSPRRGSSLREEVGEHEGWFLATAVSLLIGRPFVPGVAIAREGYGAIFVMLWLLLLVAWLVGRLAKSQRSSHTGPHDQQGAGTARTRLDALVLAFFVLYSLSGVIAAVVASPRPAVNTTWHWLSVGIAYFFFRQLIQNSVARRGAVAVVVGLSTAMAALGLEQALVSLPGARSVYARWKDSPQELYAHTGEWLPEGSVERKQFEARLRTAEPTATFALSNSLAGLLVPGIVLAVGIVLTRLHAQPRIRGPMPWLALPLLIMVGCLLFTNSRSGAAATAIVGGGVVVFTQRHRWRWILGGVAVACLGGGALLAVRPDAVTAAGRSLAFRWDYWRATWAMIGDFPLFGCGPGQFQDTYTAYKLPTASEEVADPHNFLLEVWSTGGTLSALVLLAAMAAVVWHIRRCAGSRCVDPRGAGERSQGGAQQSVRAKQQTRYAYAGAAGGVVLGAAATWLDGIAMLPLPLGLFAATFALTLAILHQWVVRGHMPWWLPAVATGGLLLHWTVAGGIGEPALATILWLLVVCQLDAGRGPSRDRPRARSLFDAMPGIRWRASVGLLAAGGLVIAAYLTYYRPVLQSSAAVARADAAAVAGELAARLHALESAAEADPWSIEAPRRLARIQFATWQQAGSEVAPATWREPDARLRQLAPRRHGVWRESAERYASVHAQEHAGEALARAIALVRRAIALYPTYAEHHLFHAELLLRADRRQEARRALFRAKQLDDLQDAAGHADRTLASERRQRLEDLSRQLE